MGETLERARVGQVVGLRLRGEDIVHPRILCRGKVGETRVHKKKEREREREDKEGRREKRGQKKREKKQREEREKPEF